MRRQCPTQRLTDSDRAWLCQHGRSCAFWGTLFSFQEKEKKKKEMSNPRRKGTECLLKLHHEEIAIVKGCCIVLAFLRNLKIYPEF